MVGAQTNVINIPVANSSSFYVGTLATIAGVSGTEARSAIPDATHVRSRTSTLAAASEAGTMQLRPSSIAGMAVGHSVTVDIGANADTSTITAVGAGTGSHAWAPSLGWRYQHQGVERQRFCAGNGI